MRSPRFLRLTLFAATLSLPELVSLHPLQAQIPVNGAFTATKACPAQRAINGENPGNIRLTVGDRGQWSGGKSA